MLFFYRIDGRFAVGAPVWRCLISRSPVALLLRTHSTFPPNHPTTKMCLRLILRDLRVRQHRRLVDVGCGSGILALAGLALGIEHAVGLDISRKALLVSRSNAALNGLAKRLLLVQGSTEAIDGDFDLVLANLPMPVIIEKLAELVRLGGYGASWILSGFQDLNKPAVQQQMAKLGLKAKCWLAADLSFFDAPPSESFTWVAVLAGRCREKCD